MKIVKVIGRVTLSEKETQLNYNSEEKMWEMYSFVSKHYNKALKQGWTPTVKYEYEDGTVAGYTLVAPPHAITIRNAEKRQVSDKQRANLINNEDYDNDEDE